MLRWRVSENLQVHFEAGPICCVCHERYRAVIVNNSCQHEACEDCWARWAETQLHACRAQKVLAVTCLGAGCREAVTQGVWQHLCTRSEDSHLMDKNLTTRRKLQSNHLFPAALQAECPRFGCVGIGYLGSDTVMCFICEEQWNADGEAPPEDGGVLMDGVVMKKCPKCDEYIEKNGGCDHMTCRCKFEFYWTTLKPYRLL